MLLQNYIPRYTHQDYKLWEGDWELINGYPYAMSPSPLLKHQRIGRKFLQAISNELDNKKNNCLCEAFYETDWKISEDTIVRPDIVIVCGSINVNDIITTTPILIVEIFSPSTRLKDRNLKFNLYQQCGVKYYLMADPDAKTIECFVLTNNAYIEMKNEWQFQLTNTCHITLSPEPIFAD